MKNVSIKKILLAIITLGIGLGLHLGSSKILKLAGITFTSNILDLFVNEVIFAAVSITIIFIIKKKSLLSPNKNGFLKGIKSALPVIIYSITLILVSLSKLQDNTLVKGWEIALFILFCLLIGVAEEGLFRGAVQELVLDAFTIKKKKQLIWGIIISSAIFGSSHFINLRMGINLSSVIFQVISATTAGMLFGAICVHSGRSIWPVVIAHALMDCGSFINSGMLWGQDEVSAINGITAGALITSVVDVLLFFYIMNQIDEESEISEVHTDATTIEAAEKTGIAITSYPTKKSRKKGIIIGVALTSFILVIFLVIIPLILTSF